VTAAKGPSGSQEGEERAINVAEKDRGIPEVDKFQRTEGKGLQPGGQKRPESETLAEILREKGSGTL